MAMIGKVTISTPIASWLSTFTQGNYVGISSSRRTISMTGTPRSRSFSSMLALVDAIASCYCKRIETVITMYSIARRVSFCSVNRL